MSGQTPRPRRGGGRDGKQRATRAEASRKTAPDRLAEAKTPGQMVWAAANYLTSAAANAPDDLAAPVVHKVVTDLIAAGDRLNAANARRKKADV